MEQLGLVETDSDLFFYRETEKEEGKDGSS